MVCFAETIVTMVQFCTGCQCMATHEHVKCAHQEATLAINIHSKPYKAYCIIFETQKPQNDQHEHNFAEKPVVHNRLHAFCYLINSLHFFGK